MDFEGGTTPVLMSAAAMHRGKTTKKLDNREIRVYGCNHDLDRSAWPKFFMFSGLPVK